MTQLKADSEQTSVVGRQRELRLVTAALAAVVTAARGFRLVASMNPFDNIGTSRISSSVYDRLCRVSVSYQSALDEMEIVRLRTSATENGVDDSVALTRLTRRHPLVRQGSSVRGAIDMALVAEQLITLDRPADEKAYAATMRDAMHVALSGRIRLDEAAGVTPESVLDELWEQRYLLGKRRAEPG